MEKKSRLILILILILIVVIALIPNRGMAHFSFLFWKLSISPLLLISLLLLIGFALGYLAGRRGQGQDH